MFDQAERLAEFIPVRHWVADHTGEVFRTFASFEWFVRRHRAALVASGQFIPRSGSGGSLCGPKLEQVVLGILRAEAQGREAAA